MLVAVSSTGLALSCWDMEPQEVRELINQKISFIKAEKPDVQNVADIEIHRCQRITPLRIYTPNESDCLPVILLIHGGGWVAGNLETHDNMARYLCSNAKALVVSVAYLNAPEGKFPLPLEQCYDALHWVIEQAKELKVDVTNLAVVGDSAGGNMAAALCLLSRDRKGPAIKLQVLINPSTDLTGKGTLKRQGDELDTMRWYASQYVADLSDVYNPYVSPLLAKDLTQLPTALIILAEKDDLRECGLLYANRLIEAGVKTNTYTQWNIEHLAGSGARASERAKESLDVVVAALLGSFRKN